MNFIKKNIKFHWEKKYDDIFKIIKKLVKSIQFLQYINYESKESVWFITNASNREVSEYITQNSNWKTTHSIDFYSSQYHSIKINYSIHEQEILIIISYIKY